MTKRDRDEQAMDFAYGNLAASTNHKPDREAFRRLWAERGLPAADFDVWAAAWEWRDGCGECRLEGQHKLSCARGATLALGGDPRTHTVRNGVLVLRRTGPAAASQEPVARAVARAFLSYRAELTRRRAEVEARDGKLRVAWTPREDDEARRALQRAVAPWFATAAEDLVETWRRNSGYWRDGVECEAEVRAALVAAGFSPERPAFVTCPVCYPGGGGQHRADAPCQAFEDRDALVELLAHAVVDATPEGEPADAPAEPRPCERTRAMFDDPGFQWPAGTSRAARRCELCGRLVSEHQER